jgi:hypothetical protein
MTSQGAEGPSLRASDADRERIVQLLRDCVVDGRLTHESFVRRLDLALHARDQFTLGALVSDLPRRASLGAVAVLRTKLDAVAQQLSLGPKTPRLRPLMLPPSRQRMFTIGRDPACDLVLGDRTVSRTHAVLRAFGDQWFLNDLGSTNGTRLNGYRIREATAVHPGDRVAFGRPSFLIEPAANETRRR